MEKWGTYEEKSFPDVEHYLLPQFSLCLLNLKYIHLLNKHYYIIIVKKIELYI